jgi:hypothetical protein
MSSLSTTTTTTTQQILNWYMKADYIETCICDFGCPCNFIGFPTYGNCRALVLYLIKEGNYRDNVKLDSLDVTYAISWPKANHEGNETLFITKNANEKQRQAIVDIFAGKAKGDSPFATLGGTLNTY